MSQQSPGRRRSNTGSAPGLSIGVPMSIPVAASGMRPEPPVNGITGPGRQAVTGTTVPDWVPRPLPFTLPDAKLLGRWEPATPATLTATRMDLAARLHDGLGPPGADEGTIERLLLVYEELASNALRHGRPPVCVELTTCA